MAWSLHRWVWRVESPLHIGMVPAGMLNRTRLYVPARALWGALTAELARLSDQGVPKYEEVGAELREKTRLSYLYPAEIVNGQWMAWFPRYQEGEGLVWEREDGKVEGERKFRMRLLITRPGTAIEPESDTAAEGTLREFELISPYWRKEGPSTQPVALVGYLFCKDFCKDAAKDAALLQKLEQVCVLWVGGDSRYGLGKLKRVARQEANEFFKETVDLRGDQPVVETARVLAHTIASSGHASLVGAMEQLGGWDIRRGGLISQGLTWAPGSVSQKSQVFVIQEDGLWRMG